MGGIPNSAVVTQWAFCVFRVSGSFCATRRPTILRAFFLSGLEKTKSERQVDATDELQRRLGLARSLQSHTTHLCNKR